MCFSLRFGFYSELDLTRSWTSTPSLHTLRFRKELRKEHDPIETRLQFPAKHFIIPSFPRFPKPIYPFSLFQNTSPNASEMTTDAPELLSLPPEIILQVRSPTRLHLNLLQVFRRLPRHDIFFGVAHVNRRFRDVVQNNLRTLKLLVT